MVIDQKRVTTIVVLVALVIIAWLVYAVIRTNPSSLNPSSLTAEAPGMGMGISKTWAAVPANTSIPGEGDSGVSSGVAVPDAVLAASIGSDADFRLFRISVKNDAFSPDTVVVRQGDTMRILLDAVDKDYDFVQPDNGLSNKIPKGKQRGIEFSGMSAGKFTFYCSSCGGPDKGPVGYIIVVPQK